MPSADTRLPSFLLIGAAKSGTTALYRYLAQHPQIYMSPVKEANFFSVGADGYHDLDCPVRFAPASTSALRWEAYVDLFARAAGEKQRGEASPTYLWSLGAPARIRDALPGVRLIAVLRHPVDRAYSAYSHAVRDGYEDRSFPRAVEDELQGGPPAARDMPRVYLQQGFYHRHLSRYFDLFPRESILVVFHHDLIAAPEIFMDRCLAFLDVDTGFRPDMSKRSNRSGRVRNAVVRRLWTGSRGLRSALRPIVPDPVRDAFSTFIQDRLVPLPAMDADTRRRLLALYREDVLALQERTNTDLSRWL